MVWSLFTSFLISFIFRTVFEKLIFRISHQRELMTRYNHQQQNGDNGDHNDSLMMDRVEKFFMGVDVVKRQWGA